jgi:hypothetical protein
MVSSHERVAASYSSIDLVQRPPTTCSSAYLSLSLALDTFRDTLGLIMENVTSINRMLDDDLLCRVIESIEEDDYACSVVGTPEKRALCAVVRVCKRWKVTQCKSVLSWVSLLTQDRYWANPTCTEPWSFLLVYLVSWNR